MSGFEISCFKVVVWGLPASGQETLVHALLNSLETYQPASSGLIFYIQEVLDKENEEEELHFPLGSQSAFYRIGRKRANGEIVDSGVSASVFEHFLEINDHPRADILDDYRNMDMLILALDPTQLKEADEYFYHTSRLADKSRDPEEIDLSEFVRQSIFFRNDPNYQDKLASFALEGKLSRAEYAAQVDRLHVLCADDCHVEVCVTKVDKLPSHDRQLQPAKLVSKYFGNEMKEVLRKFNEKRIYYFYTPSADNSQNELAQSDELGKPLLLLMQEYEMEQLLHTRSWFQSIVFGRDNMKNYIPYFKSNYS